MATSVMLQCEQAIFTSIRGPMGEGYRIIAASRGLRPEEKQAITRLSPSHDALCWKPAGTEDDATRNAAAFYPLPTGRLCVAFSCYAGAEHTARGGQRVYTHNVVFDEQDFPRFGFNPFHVIRAMAAAGLTAPQLEHNAPLQEIRLSVNTNHVIRKAPFTVSPDSRYRRCVLQRLLDERAVIVPAQEEWLESTEALLMGLPGPLRAGVSFSAGLRYSLSRGHRLHLLRDDKGAARARIAGQQIEYLDPTLVPTQESPSAWVDFVERHWDRADCVGLARRTSRSFTDLTRAGFERIGNLYNAIDALSVTPSLELLNVAASHIRARSGGVEEEIRLELVAETQQTLLGRLTSSRWQQARPLWPRLVALWKHTAAAFAQPLIETILHTLLNEDALTAAEVALDIAASHPSAIDHDRHERLIEEVVNRLFLQFPGDADSDRLMKLRTRWQSVRPAHPAIRKLVDRCAVQTSAPSPR